VPRYEKQSGKKPLFWEITLKEATLSIRSGEVGGEGTLEKKRLRYEYEAGMEMGRLIKAQEKKGFARVREEIPAEPSAARDPELEAALIEDPDDVDAALVYGDWLQAQGDPRGELIVAQHALSRSPRRGSLADAVLRLRAPYDAQLRALAQRHDLCAPDKERGRIQVTWGLGFIRGARLAHDHFATGQTGDASLSETLIDFLQLPSARLLQELTVGLWRNDDGQCEYRGVAEALAKLRPPALRRLHLADFKLRRETEISWTDLGDLEPIWGALPRLREVVLQGGEVRLGAIRAPSLRSFELRTGGLSAASMRSIAALEAPALERLVIWFGDPRYGGDAGLEDLRPLLDRRDLPALRHLGLCNALFQDAICELLGSSSLLEQVEVLDLSMGLMSDEGAAALARARPRLKSLRELIVDDNYLTGAARKTLKGLCPKLTFGEQKEPYVWDDGSQHRYVSVSE